MQAEQTALIKIARSLSGMKILVLGDTMLDAYLKGEVTRISPEAPVPVLRFQEKSHFLGGAANVAFNLKKLGTEPILLSVIGDDESAAMIEQFLKDQGMSRAGLMRLKGRRTTVKTRVISGGHQLLRIDDEDDAPIALELLAPLFEQLESLLAQEEIAGVLLSDYAKGLLHKDSLAIFQKHFMKAKLYTALDPAEKNFHLYHDISLMTPNKKEASKDIGLPLETKPEILAAGSAIMRKHNLRQLLITLGEEGMAIFPNEKDAAEKDAAQIIPSFTRFVRDVSGAGDTVISVCLACLLQSKKFYESALIGNLAAGISVSHFGTFACSIEDIVEEIKERF